jgi:intracellular multiplication protein IcmK
MSNNKNKNFGKAFVDIAALLLCLITTDVFADEAAVLLPPNMSLPKVTPISNTTSNTAKTLNTQKNNLALPVTTPVTASAAINTNINQQHAPTEEASQTSENISNQAFLGVLNKQLPMTPEQIANLRKAFDNTQKAAATAPSIPPRPTTSSILVNLSPSSVPPVIRLGSGYISSLEFIDSTEQPWPIEAYSVGDPGSFNIQWNKVDNTLLVQATSFYKRSNLAVILKNLNTPVMLTLLPGQTAVDYRVDLRVPGAGPNAIFSQGTLPSASDPELLNVLNGVPPANARSLKVIGDGQTHAWLINNILYVRTPLVIISPAWQSIMSSIDGTHAYQLQPSSVLLTLHRGKDKILKLVLEGLE